MGTDLSTHGDPKRGIDNSFRCFRRICTPPPPPRTQADRSGNSHQA